MLSPGYHDCTKGTLTNRNIQHTRRVASVPGSHPAFHRFRTASDEKLDESLGPRLHKELTSFHEKCSLLVIGVESSGKHVRLLQAVQEDKQLRSAEVAKHALLRTLGGGAGGDGLQGIEEISLEPGSQKCALINQLFMQYLLGFATSEV